MIDQIMAAIWIYYTRSRLASWAQEASKFQISWINHVFPQKCTARDRSSDPSHGSLKLYHWTTEPIDTIWPNLVTFILLSKKPQNWLKLYQIIANVILHWIYIILANSITLRGAVTPNIRWCAPLILSKNSHLISFSF